MNPKKLRGLLLATKAIHMQADESGAWLVTVTDVDGEEHSEEATRDPLKSLERLVHDLFIMRKRAGKGL